MGKVEFQFPIKGKDTNNPIEKQPLQTSPDLENVRPYDQLEIRMRGGQRPGCRKWGAGSRIGGGDYRIDKLVAGSRGTMPGDCPDEESCESQGYNWWGSACHTYPLLPDPPANLWKCVEDTNRAVVVWNYDEGGWVTNVTVDGSGNIYITSFRTAGAKILNKLDSSRNLLWDYATGGSILTGVAVDGSGNVYITGARTGDKSVWKLDSDGNLVADYDTGAQTSKVELDSSGNVFVTGARAHIGGGIYRSVWKLDSSLNHTARIDTGANTIGLAIDGSDNIYITGRRTGNKTVWKKTNGLSAVWDYDTGDGLNCNTVTIDSSGNVIIGNGSGATDSKELWQLDNAGNFNWYADCDSSTATLDLAIDGSDNIYVVGNRSSNKCLWVFDSSGNLLWSDDTGDTLSGVFLVGTDIYIAGKRIT